MKKIIKLSFFILFITVSNLVSAQSFTLAELVDLVPNGNEYFSKVVTAKGYTHKENGKSDLSHNYVYNHSDNSKIMLITPSFNTDLRMVSWEFKTTSFFKALKDELAMNEYQLTHTEKRDGGKYVSLFYSKPGVEVILTTDKTTAPSGIHTASIKYANASKYIVK